MKRPCQRWHSDLLSDPERRVWSGQRGGSRLRVIPRDGIIMTANGYSGASAD